MWKVCLQKCKKILKNYILYLKDGLITGRRGRREKKVGDLFGFHLRQGELPSSLKLRRDKVMARQVAFVPDKRHRDFRFASAERAEKKQLPASV